MVSIIKSYLPLTSFKGFCSSVQSLLAMDPLRKKVDLIGRKMTEGALQFVPHMSEQQEKNTLDIPHFNPTQLNTGDTFITTAGICSQILFYGAFYAGVCAAVGPVDSWSTTAILFGPWWSSSYWMDWLIYDFFRSAIDLEDFNLKSLDHFLNRWIPHNHNEHLRDAYKYRKLCLTLCAVIVCATYLSVCSQRPPANQVLAKRFKDVLPLLSHIQHPELFQDFLGF